MSIDNFNIGRHRWLTHLLFWSMYILVFTGVHSDGDDGWRYYFTIELMGLPGAVLVAYMNMYVLFPWLFVRKRYGWYIISAIVLLFAASLMNRVLSECVFEPVFLSETTHRDDIFVWYFLLKAMLWFLSPVLMFTLVLRIFKQSYYQEQHQQELAREKLGAELNFLKAQVHPHFLFNTLNNLYSLTLQASPVAPVVVLKLSELMSYMLYDAQLAGIALDKEISHIQNYIQLEQLRYGNRLDVSLNVSGDTGLRQVAPLLLIPFVENAFKHGVSNETDAVWVTIDIKVKGDWLQVKVENSHTDLVEDTPAPANLCNGIGLQNVVRRLMLLYPQAHELQQKKEPGRYTVDLKIKLPG
ncbi:sensor histidine kinase [Chitinophaga sp. Ak27]|uniref:sensor histidine kinase n=1 Tax=Chitinophaga sp. Ak27 TaxID=2726116 RepID=UPI00145DC47F|nr:histidine kinase [Chitinophaga sp. Ak27]NLU95748.1 histidine kinase [Chitinophaga sp. Ak27]